MLVFIILVILLLALYIIVKKCLSDDNYDEKITEIKQPIEKNKNIAIIGDNGSGKTILSKTLLGFYNYTGDIYIGKNRRKKASQRK